MDHISSKKILGQQSRLDSEILQEIAEALGNAGAKLEEALDRLGFAQRRIESLRKRLEVSAEEAQRRTLDASLKEEIARYNALRQEAACHYRDLIIHREAVGFRNHRLMDEKYRIPSRMETSDE